MNVAKKSQSLWITFLPGWILANGSGWFLISLIYIIPLGRLWATLSVGFFVSLFQWIVLQKFIGVDVMWLGVSTLTYGIFFFIFILLIT